MLRERASRLYGGLASCFRKNTTRHQRLRVLRAGEIDIGTNFVDRSVFGRRGGRPVHQVTGELEPSFGGEGSGPGQEGVDPACETRDFPADLRFTSGLQVGRPTVPPAAVEPP